MWNNGSQINTVPILSLIHISSFILQCSKMNTYIDISSCHWKIWYRSQYWLVACMHLLDPLLEMDYKEHLQRTLFMNI